MEGAWMVCHSYHFKCFPSLNIDIMKFRKKNQDEMILHGKKHFIHAETDIFLIVSKYKESKKKFTIIKREFAMVEFYGLKVKCLTCGDKINQDHMKQGEIKYCSCKDTKTRVVKLKDRIEVEKGIYSETKYN